MLKIRQAQMKLFADREVLKFEDWMVSHIRKFFPRATARRDETQLRALIRSGIQRAADHGIRSRRGVCKYIDLMVVFGADFDVHPDHPWAARALRDWKSEDGRIDALFRAGVREERARLRHPSGA